MPTPTLNAEEMMYTDTGLLINGGPSVPFLDIENVTGLDSVDPRTSEAIRENVDGGYFDSAYEGIRSVVVEGTLYGNPFNLETTLDALKANFAVRRNASPLYFGTDAGVRVVYGKSQGFRYPKERDRSRGVIKFQFTIVCEDPRIYAPDTISAEVVLGSTTVAGRGFNKSYTYGYGPAASTNQLILTLGGNRPQPGTLHIYGPAINPIIYNDDTGAQMSFNYTINNGDYVEIDLDRRTVKLNSITNVRRRMTLFGRFFLFRAGTNTLRLTASGTAAGVTKLVATARPAAWR